MSCIKLRFGRTYRFWTVLKKVAFELTLQRKRGAIERALMKSEDTGSKLALQDGSCVGVIGGGPAGSFFSYFLLKMAETLGIELKVDIYEPRRFSYQGPAGCNHCGGVVSESLVQILATEGINLPATVVQRGIDSYVLHMDVGVVRIDTPLLEKRIAAVYRGNGPRGQTSSKWGSFDGFLQDLAVRKGAKVVSSLVNGFEWIHGRPAVKTPEGNRKSYDLVVGAAGVNTNLLQMLNLLDQDYQPPRLAKTFICEFHLGQVAIQKLMGASMHVFLLDLPRLEFAALIPKGDCVTMCLLGDGIDDELVGSFLNAPEVRACFPADTGVPVNACHCFPRINMKGAVQPFGDRLVMIGDCGVTRLFKDGIGAAFKTAKAAATTAVFHGVGEEDFRKHYWPVCQRIAVDNMIGKIVFTISHQLQRIRLSRRAVLRMTSKEQTGAIRQHMSTVLWDVFTGSAPYREVFLRTLHPGFLVRLIWNLLVSAFPAARPEE